MKKMAVAAATAVLAGCGFASTTNDAADYVGENVLAAYERDIESVAEIDLPEPRLFTNQGDWEDWYSTLPTQVQEHEVDGLPGPSFNDSVTVAGVFPSCGESLAMVHNGDGKIAFVVEGLAEGSEPCTEYLYLFSVYEVPLDQIGVSDPSEVELVGEYRRLG